MTAPPRIPKGSPRAAWRSARSAASRAVTKWTRRVAELEIDFANAALPDLRRSYEIDLKLARDALAEAVRNRDTLAKMPAPENPDLPSRANLDEWNS